MRIGRLLICLSMLASPAFATEERQSGTVIYSLPDQWYTGKAEDGIQVALNRLPDEVCRFCLLYFKMDEPARGSLEDYLLQNLGFFLDKDDKPMKLAGQIQTMMASGVPAVMAPLMDNRHMAVVVAFAPKDRFALIAFQGRGGDTEEVVKSFAYFRKDIAAMLDQLHFVSEGAAPLMPPPQPGDLSGVYWGWHQTTTLGINNMLNLDVENRTLVFYPNGTFYDGAPPKGINDPLDARALAFRTDLPWGSYRHDGNKIVLSFADGQSEILIRKDDGWDDDNQILSQQPVLADGTRLNGYIHDIFSSGTPPVGDLPSTSIASESSTTFFPDGHYEGKGFGGAFGTFDSGGFSTYKEHSNHGRYTVKDGLLIQYPSDGGTPTASLALRLPDGILIGDKFLETE